MTSAIKNPTSRKVRNRGLVPMRYRLPDKPYGAYVYGWIVNRGPKYLHFHCSTLGRTLRVPLAEERYMREVA